MKNQQERNEEKILKKYEKLINKLAYITYRKYNGKYALEDLIQEARLGAIKGYRIFDPKKNVKEITHIHNYINFSISHYLRTDTGTIKIPSNVITDASKIKPEIVYNEFYSDIPNKNIIMDSLIDSHVEAKILSEQYLSILTDKNAEILKMLHMDGFSCDEIAKKLGVSRQYINSTAIRSRSKIYNTFKQQHMENI
jgi:RNA polymerase sporulation-specific sigma factor